MGMKSESMAFQFYPRSTNKSLGEKSGKTRAFNSIQDQHELGENPFEKALKAFNSIQDQQDF